MAKTKTHKKKLSKKALAKNMQYAIYGLNTLVIFLIFINAVILLSGGWDDLRAVEILCLPILSIIALALASINVVRFASKGVELLVSIFALAASAFAVFFYFIYPVLVPLLAS